MPDKCLLVYSLRIKSIMEGMVAGAPPGDMDTVLHAGAPGDMDTECYMLGHLGTWIWCYMLGLSYPSSGRI